MKKMIKKGDIITVKNNVGLAELEGYEGKVTTVHEKNAKEVDTAPFTKETTVDVYIDGVGEYFFSCDDIEIIK